MCFPTCSRDRNTKPVSGTAVKYTDVSAGTGKGRAGTGYQRMGVGGGVGGTGKGGVGNDVVVRRRKNKFVFSEIRNCIPSYTRLASIRWHLFFVSLLAL